MALKEIPAMAWHHPAAFRRLLAYSTPVFWMAFAWYLVVTLVIVVRRHATPLMIELLLAGAGIVTLYALLARLSMLIEKLREAEADERREQCAAHKPEPPANDD